ncbi:MAG: SCP2 sterol-binding domain-containing protein [Candidatus Heimdallarchaeota archaeon]
MMSLVCSNCGREVETVSMQCALSITLNGETNKWECDMGRCGVISFDKFLCENCCINSSIMEIFYGFERLANDNEEFREELAALKTSVIQTTLVNPDLKYWVKFGNGEFKCGRGEIEGATVNVNCSQEVLSKILAGNSTAFSEFLQGNLKLEGDLQYAVVFFDLLGLAAEINNEKVMLYNE